MIAKRPFAAIVQHSIRRDGRRRGGNDRRNDRNGGGGGGSGGGGGDSERDRCDRGGHEEDGEEDASELHLGGIQTGSLSVL